MVPDSGESLDLYQVIHQVVIGTCRKRSALNLWVFLAGQYDDWRFSRGQDWREKMKEVLVHQSNGISQSWRITVV